MRAAIFERINALALVGLLFFGASGACKSKSPPPETDASASAPPSNLTDLSSSLDAVRTAFNAHKHEARFLTLLSPA